jgi:amino acid transporter
LALVKGGFLPKILAVRNGTFNTPHIAVGIATSIPILVILSSGGEMKLLGDMYAFGLLGAFVFSSLSLDSIRWRLGRRDFGFWLGVFTTAIVMLAWGVQLGRETSCHLFRRRSRRRSAMLTAIGVRRAWFVDLLVQIPFLQRLQARAYRASEDWLKTSSRVW